MAELEIKTFVLSDAVQNLEQHRIQDYKKTFTLFDYGLKERNFSPELNPEKVIRNKTKVLNVLRERISKVSKKLEEAEKQNGFLGRLWDGTKNLTGLGDSSNKVKKHLENELVLLEKDIRTAFFEITGEEYTIENIRRFLNSEIKTKSELALEEYIAGQELAVDNISDIISGISALGVYIASISLAPLSGGASIGLGILLAGTAGATIKSGIKYAETKSSDKAYGYEELKEDAISGAFSGVIAPITGGVGGAVGKTVASRVGVLAIEQIPKTVTKQTSKSLFLNPTGYEYLGGSIFTRAISFSSEVATDGALSGGLDNAFRTACSGGCVDEITQSALDGLWSGLVFSPIIGGGIKGVGKILPKPVRYYVPEEIIRKKLSAKNVITADDIKLLFPTGKLEENEFTKEVDRIISEIAEKRKNEPDYKVIDFRSDLTEKDYEMIAELINIDKNKYLDIWLGYSRTDDIPNLQKLAMFAKVVQFTHQQKDFLKFDEKQWDIVVKGIITKPQDWIYPILRYKLDSSEINKALDTGTGSAEIKKIIKTIRAYLSLYETKEDITVYRGEGSYAVLNASGDATLVDRVIEFTEKINAGEVSKEEIEDFANQKFKDLYLYQKRFISTGMTKEAVLPYQKVIAWEEIVIPKGTKGAFIESFCVERAKEAEFLIMDNMKITITNAEYKMHNGKMKWVFKGKIVPK